MIFTKYHATYAAAGKVGQAQEVLEQLSDITQHAFTSPYQRALESAARAVATDPELAEAHHYIRDCDHLHLAGRQHQCITLAIAGEKRTRRRVQIRARKAASGNSPIQSPLRELRGTDKTIP